MTASTWALTLVASFVGSREAVGRYVEGMRRRFASLRITNEPPAVIPDAELS